jgi:hypothetical protein
VITCLTFSFIAQFKDSGTCAQNISGIKIGRRRGLSYVLGGTSSTTDGARTARVVLGLSYIFKTSDAVRSH